MSKENIIYKPKFWKPIKSEDIILNKSVFNNFGFDKHVHEEFAIGVIGKGSINGFLDGKNRIINKNTIMTINPDTAHSNWAHGEDIYWQAAIYLNQSFFSKISKENFNSKDIFFKSGLFEDETLSNELLSLTLSYERLELSELDYECKLIDILNKILLKNCKVKEQKNLSKHDLAILKAKEIMNDKLSEDLTLDDISSELDISKYYFLRLFKEQTHFSPHAYLMLKRLEKAKQLLQKGYSPIYVAHECGFNDQSHLNKRFKSFVGVTAKEYQKFFI